MASTSAITGLVSGIDTKTVVKQLMSIAKQPQDALKTDLSTTNSQVTAAQAVNTKAASMASLAKDLAAAKTFTTATASSSDASVSASTSSTATSGSVTFKVASLAAAQTTLSDVVPSSGSDQRVTVSWTTSDGAATSKDYDGASAADIANAINGDASAAVTATVVNQTAADGTATSRLQLTAKETGTARAFSAAGAGFTDGSGSATSTTVTAASDAVIRIGGAEITSPKNTFANLMQGVDVTVSKADPDKSVTVSTAVSQSSISTKVTALVAAMNTVLSDVSFHTQALTPGATASSTTGGLLRGASSVRDLGRQVVGAVSGGAADGASAPLAGLSVTRSGEITFDAAVFAKLYAKDPAQAAAVLQKFAGAVQSAGELASSATTGSVTSYITGNQASARSLTDGIAGWDTRLAAKQQRLEKQYAALEVALGKLSSQSDSLTSALKSLNGSSD